MLPYWIFAITLSLIFKHVLSLVACERAGVGVLDVLFSSLRVMLFHREFVVNPYCISFCTFSDFLPHSRNRNANIGTRRTHVSYPLHLCHFSGISRASRHAKMSIWRFLGGDSPVISADNHANCAIKNRLPLATRFHNHISVGVCCRQTILSSLPDTSGRVRVGLRNQQLLPRLDQVNVGDVISSHQCLDRHPILCRDACQRITR